jgi:hypothetical protein
VLRQAQAQALVGRGAHDLREASQQRRELVEELTNAALQELERLGTGNPEGSRAAVATTLEAALVDEQVAEQLRACRLAVGLRRTARLADGWLASAYNTTPEGFADAWSRLQEQLVEHGRSPNGFANALATMWFHLTDDRSEAQRVMSDRVLPAINRPEDVLRERLPIGPAEAFAERLAAFRDAGVQRVFIWPVADEIDQLRRFHEEVVPLLD